MSDAPTLRPAAVCPTCGALLIDNGTVCFTHGAPQSDVEQAFALYCAQADAWTKYIAALAPLSAAARDELRSMIDKADAR